MQITDIYPVATASFERIRSEGYVYVDKTEYIAKMLKEKGVFYFLARPRRFGKSLFLDTLRHYFKGNRSLFKGLAIDSLLPEEWEKYPVMHFNLSGNTYNNEKALDAILEGIVGRQELDFDLHPEGVSVCERFNNLIINLNKKSGRKVVILIDEYDAPLSDTINQPELQEFYRQLLHGFYSVLKKCDNEIKFCMLTGVTRYGKVSVFSGLNNLNDITFDNHYAGICGITEKELKTYYSEGVGALAKKENISQEDAFSLLKFHYDGYHFSKSLLDVYNPFSINHAMQKQEISDYWCRSGVPTLLSKTLMDNDVDVEQLNGTLATDDNLSNLTISGDHTLALLYQTGYLTIKGYDKEEGLYAIGYPNREVEKGLFSNILKVYVTGSPDPGVMIMRMRKSLKEGYPDLFVKLFSAYTAGIPNKRKRFAGQYENYYHTIFYCITSPIGLDVSAEFGTSEGFVDILIKTDKFIYIIELKVNGSAEDAIRQIDEKHYFKPFDTDSRNLFKIGIGFSKKKGTVESSIIL